MRWLFSSVAFLALAAWGCEPVPPVDPPRSSAPSDEALPAWEEASSAAPEEPAVAEAEPPAATPEVAESVEVATADLAEAPVDQAQPHVEATAAPPAPAADEGTPTAAPAPIYDADLLNGWWVQLAGSEVSGLVHINNGLHRLVQEADRGDLADYFFFEVASIDGNVYMLDTAGRTHSGPMPVVFTSPDTFLTVNPSYALAFADSPLQTWQRAEAPGEDLQGDWVLEMRWSEPRITTVRFDDRRLHLEGTDYGSATFDAFRLVNGGPNVTLALFRNYEYPTMVWLSPISGDPSASQDAYIWYGEVGLPVQFLYREGRRPAWIDRLVVEEPETRAGESGAIMPWAEEAEWRSAGDPVDPLIGFDGAGVGWAITEDVTLNLQSIAEDASRYYEGERAAELGNGEPPPVAQLPASTDWTPPLGECAAPYFGSEPFLSGTWATLGFAPAGEYYYQYRFINSSTEEALQFEAQARIDRDCDGVFNKLSIDGAVNALGTIDIGSVVEDSPGE